MHKQPSLKNQQDLVLKLNHAFSIGDKMKVRQDNGDIAEWTVRWQASILGGHTAVIWANEHAGCYNANRVILE